MTRLKNTLWVFYGVLILTAIASQVANAQSWTAPKYDCKPKSQEEYRIGRENGITVALWYCDLPTKIKINYFTGDVKNIPSLTVIPSIDKIGSFLQSALSRPATQAELDLVEKVHQQLGVKIIVAANGTTGSRPSYFPTATNTKGADTGKRAVSGAYCGWKRLQDSTGKGTAYFEVADAPGTFTQCVVMGLVTKP